MTRTPYTFTDQQDLSMAMTMQVWSATGDNLRPLAVAKVDLEKQLENWIENDISLIGIDAIVIGRQVRTDHGGFIDLLAINDQGQLVIIELKRSKTPREVVAQCLDYGSWVHGLKMDAVMTIFEHSRGQSLSQAFAAYFDVPLPEEIDPNYQIVIVAESLDDASERIVRHLSDVHKININAVFFNVFELNETRLLARSWLTDPQEVEERSSQGKKPRWTGYLFVNTGITADNYRDWDLNIKYNYISAGGGPRWINAIKKLQPGDKIFAFTKGKGYVGYGMVEEEAVPVGDFQHEEQPLVDVLPEDCPWHQPKALDEDEWLVRVKWHATVPESDAKWFLGAFANQNVVCKIRDENTASFLEREFGVEPEKQHEH